MTLTLHHLGQSRSERIIWLLEELQIEYVLERHKRDGQTRLAPDSLARLHPLGKAPLLVHDDRVIAESGAIAMYLLEQFDAAHRVHPDPGQKNRAVFLEWMHAAEGAIFLPFLMNTYLTMTGLEDSILAQYMAGERKKALGAVEAHLADNDWFAGSSFTAADIMMGFQLENADRAGAIDKDSPVKAWLEKIRDRDAYKAMRKVTAED
ncbi:MAG: glutathione S-transferase family protein [Oceanicaulis sp.]